MIDDLLKVRKVCEEAVLHGNTELVFSVGDWTALEEIRETMQPIYIATKQLQSKNVTLTDVRKITQVCWIKTAEIGDYLIFI